VTWVRARRGLLASAYTARQLGERLTTGGAVTGRMAAARRGQQHMGIMEPR
jgi:hypothetical protein